MVGAADAGERHRGDGSAAGHTHMFDACQSHERRSEVARHPDSHPGHAVAVDLGDDLASVVSGARRERDHAAPAARATQGAMDLTGDLEERDGLACEPREPVDEATLLARAGNARIDPGPATVQAVELGGRVASPGW